MEHICVYPKASHICTTYVALVANALGPSKPEACADPCWLLLLLFAWSLLSVLQKSDTMATVVATPAAAVPGNKLSELSTRLGAEGEYSGCVIVCRTGHQTLAARPLV